MRRLVGCALALVLFAAGTAKADVITNGTVSVGINTSGSLYDGAGTGMQRISDGFDAISPGTPREAWGVSFNGTSGYGDPFSYGTSNLITGPSAFGAASGNQSFKLNAGSDLLAISQAFSFVAPNVLAIDVTIQNISGAAGAVLYSRQVDWDIFPTTFSEFSTANAIIPPVMAGSYYGFENPDPLVPLAFQFPAAGGTFGAGDLGGGMVLDLGILGAGASTSFRILHAVNSVDQSEAELRAQLAALGAGYIITGVSSDNGRTNSTGLALAGVAATPEPATMAVFGLMFVGGGRYVRRRMKATV